ncbi:MAG: uroporphyrinogen decarboxylase family protein [Anaerolineae bacterium]|nr:uroporphyrinogen decarboxylase family protein [Anaerolineae bacterium]
MAAMTPRERVLTTLSHKEPDKVPIDMGGVVTTSISRIGNEGLKAYMGITASNEIVSQPALDVVVPCEEILTHFEVDLRAVRMRPPSDTGEGRQSWFVPKDGQGVKGDHFYDEFGNRWQLAEFDYSPAGPALANATLADLDTCVWPNPYDRARVAGLREETLALRASTDFAITADIMCGGPFEQALWTRGYEQFLIDLHWDRRFADRLLGKITDLDIALWDAQLKAIGDVVDVVCQGEDMGTQHGLYISPELYRQVIKPHHRRLFSFIKANTKAALFVHSCGSVYAIIPDYIEMGVDALNPVQTGARDMDLVRLKREFGSEITFWGGAFETQYFLPVATPAQIREHVRRNIEILAPGGGFVFAGTHNITPETAPEKAYAVYAAAREFRGYAGGWRPPSG